VLCTVFALIFIAFAALQWNDPDRWIWIAVYGATAALSLLGLVGRFNVLAVPAAVGALVWAGMIRPESLGHWIDDEVAREMFGLLICGAWLTVLAAAWLASVGDRRSPPSPEETASLNA